jgi:hypothetical protein
MPGVDRSASLGFMHKFGGNAVDKTRFDRGKIHSCMHIARTAQKFVSRAFFVFSTS